MQVPQSFVDALIFSPGKPNTAYAEYFVGESFLAPLSDMAGAANVVFSPGCRNNWHIQKSTGGGGQVLLCTAGHGYYQEWGKEARPLNAGDVVEIPPNVKHWHGAAPGSWFAHIAISVPGENASTEWMEPVSEEDYGKLF